MTVREDGHICSICLGSLTLSDSSEQSNFALSCGHSFHSKCIAQWWKNQTQCPECRKVIKRDEVERLNHLISHQNEFAHRISPTIIQVGIGITSFIVGLSAAIFIKRR
ncbi:hypothetical protein SNEBB_001527, partial [Seison nebaliae]